MEESLPEIIQDLAYILIVAGISTVLFKRMKQPLVLGYIFAGFLAGPHISFMPTICNIEVCEQLGQIGVIVIMFTLGLEFSFKKIVKMGISPILCVCMIMGSMIGVGNLIGNVFDWSPMDSLFLGGMLSMSSTAIIYKAYEEMGLRHKKFAGNVLSVLILEDIMGILLLVVLSTIAATRKFEGMALVRSIMTLGSILLVWFMIGVFLLPIILKRYKRFMNKETLMIVSLALCFLLVFISSRAGYSPAFGAFMMGSILSETLEAEEIERAVSPIKDFFGAIFFVSVGMMVSPDIIIEYWMEIVVLTLGIIIGQSTLGSLSFLVTGSSLRDSIHSGFSMSQIGEFAFIIAGLGMSLHVTSPELYPIIVAVSIITTFFTPFMIKAASPVCTMVSKHVNRSIENGIYSSDSSSTEETKHAVLFYGKRLFLSLVYQTVAYVVLSYTFYGIFLISQPLVYNLLHFFTHNAMISGMVSYIIMYIITFICISPFLRAICMKKNHSIEAKYLRSHGRIYKHIINLTVVIRIVICTFILFSILDNSPIFDNLVNMIISAVFMCMIIYSREVKYLSIYLERIFKQNLYRKETVKRGPAYASHLRGQDLHISSLVVPEMSTWAGHTLKYLKIGQDNGVHIASIKRGSVRYNIPDGNSRVFPGDVLELVGDDESLESIKERMEKDVTDIKSLPENNPLILKKFCISAHSKYVGMKLLETGIRRDFRCTIIGFEDADGNLVSTDPNVEIKSDDTIWVVGEYENLELLRLVTDPPAELYVN